MCCSKRKGAAGPETAEHQHPQADPHKPCCADCAKKHAAKPFIEPLVLAVRPVPEIVHRTLSTPGRPLDRRTRWLMEAKLGADLADIRIHVDSRAAESAEAIGALAYSFGNHIVFGPGMYLPHDAAGRRILVHELAHSLQQAASWHRTGAWPEQMFESAHQSLEFEAEAIALAAVHGGAELPIRTRLSEAPLHVACLGANPDCTQGQREVIHQAIFNANAWVNNALRKLTATPTPAIVRSALRRNFGDTYGVTANLQMFIERIRRARSVMNRIPMGCNSTAPECVARHCGFAHGAGSMAVTICTVTLETGVDVRMPARCVLHESFHAAFTRFTVDSYSTGHGTSEATPGYPGAGVDPLLNADSYTTLVMDLS
jgi:hypothetical protein